MGVMTAPLARIEINGKTVGKMKNVRISESYQRGRVVGLGAIAATELPVTGFTGTMNSSFYVIDFEQHPFFKDNIDNALLRKTNDPSGFINTILLDENGFDIVLMKNEADLNNFPNEGKDTDGIIHSIPVEFATIRQVFITSDSFDISEGQISGRDGAFEYLNPIVYNI